MAIEVLSNDIEGARNFYQRLFGWSWTDTSFEPFSRYTVFERGDVQGGGILPKLQCIAAMELESSQSMPVTRLSKTQKTLGGSYVFGHTVPRAGRIGLLKDPGGALFVIRGPVPA